MLVQEFSFQELLEKMHQPDTAFVPLVKSSEDITRSVLKLVNGEGGTVVLGFDRSNMYFPGTTIGADWVHVVIKNDCTPEIEFKLKEMFRAGKKALVIEVQEGLEKPYHLNGMVQAPPKAVEPEITAEEEVVQDNITDREQETAVENESSSHTTAPMTHTETDPRNELNRREKKAVNYLKKNESISNKEYREINKVSSKTAHNELSRMIALGFVKQQGEGRLTRYVLISSDPQPQQLISDQNSAEEQPTEEMSSETDQQQGVNNRATSESKSESESESDQAAGVEIEQEQTEQREDIFPEDITASADQLQNEPDPEDDNFMKIFDDGIDFIDKLSQDIESQSAEKPEKPKKSPTTRKLNTRVPLFDLEEDSVRLTKTDLRAEGVLHSHLPV